MTKPKHIVFIDHRSCRRASMANALMRYGVHVEPLESVHEMKGRWAGVDVILTEDCDDAIPQLIQAMLKEGAWCPVIAYSDSAQPMQVINAMRAGAADYLKWPFLPDQLVVAIEDIEAGQDAVMQRRQREVIAAHLLGRLSKREREVLSGVAEGMSNKLIGHKLSISPRTVEVHRAKMMAKIGAGSSSEAVRVALDGALVF